MLVHASANVIPGALTGYDADVVHLGSSCCRSRSTT
ncbi:hypothetical protein RAM_39615 [Amycolatopsis mediterranei S699]|uniref:Uncharacterized protein n=1 Tax=Amycolatopsis mediterranei (strain S699) TaxID=713604 RepID=A0A9R0P561_AMYMS|nr:hypothetical protein RAM_39615 [Amycolatopsis mediterranei S699]